MDSRECADRTSVSAGDGCNQLFILRRYAQVMNGSRIEIQTSLGNIEAYVSHPIGPGPWPGVLFFMDGLGWRPTLFDMADRLASYGYYVLLPNMFWRSGPFAPFDAKTVFAGGPERER